MTDNKLSKICINVEDTNDSFVGVKYNKGDIKIIFPLGYRIPENDQDRLIAIKQLFKTIKLSHDKKIDFEDSGNCGDFGGLPIDSFQWIINDYLDNGIYIDNEKKYFQENKGKVNWKRTFKTKFLINKKSIIYLNPIIEKNNNIQNIISEIHGYCVDVSTKVLWFMYKKTKISNIKKPNFSYYLNIINKELINSFDDRKKLLLYHMKRIIKSNISSDLKGTIRDYGIRHYEHVWEYMINDLYGSKDIIKKDYYPDASYHIRNDDKFEEFNASKLRPDTIFKDIFNNFYILDSKYYKASIVSKDKSSLTRMLPNTDSIQKQITYGDFIFKNFQEKENINNIYNAFIIPYNKYDNILDIHDDIENIGYATCNWKDLNINQKYLRIQLIFIDTKYIVDSFFNKNNDINDLIEKIKFDGKNTKI